MTGPVVLIQYDCHYCKTKGATVEVPERFPEENVISWVDLVRALVHRHHRHYQAHCASSTVDLKIPLPTKESYIGQAGRQ